MALVGSNQFAVMIVLCWFRALQFLGYYQSLGVLQIVLTDMMNDIIIWTVLSLVRSPARHAPCPPPPRAPPCAHRCSHRDRCPALAAPHCAPQVISLGFAFAFVVLLPQVRSSPPPPPSLTFSDLL